MQITQEVVKSDAKVDKSVEKDTKTIKTEGKTMEKVEKSLEEQAAELKKSGKMKKLVAGIKDKGKKTKATNPKTEEVTTVSDVRSKAEATLVKVCKDLKLDAPTRINAKVGSKIGVGALQAKNNLGFLKAAVRATDVCLYTPYSIVKIGRPEPNKVSYPHVTLVNATDPGLAKAFERALKDKKSSSEWATELGAVSKSQVRGKENLANQKAALEAKLAAVNKRLKDEAKEQAKATKVAKPKKVKATATPAITAVAAEVA